MMRPEIVGMPGGDGPEQGSGVLMLAVGVSVLLHLFLVAAVVGVPRLFPRRPVISPGSVIAVDLVSLPGPAVGPPAESPPADAAVPLVTAADAEAVLAPETPTASVPLAEEFPAPEPAPAETEMPEPAPEIPPDSDRVVIEDASEPPRPTPPAPAETETSATPAVKRPDPRTRKPRTVAAPEVTPQAARASAIENAISQLKRKMNEKPAASAGTGGTRAGAGGRSGGVSGGVSDVYKAQVRYRIEQHWAFSGAPARGEALQSVVVVRVRPDGGIGDVWFEKRSGSTLLDDSAYRAVMKSNPLPPLPAGLNEYTMALVFTPSGLN